MRIVLIKSRTIVCTLLIGFCSMNFSCRYNKNIPIKSIDNKTITFGTKLNEQLSLTLSECIVTSDSILLALNIKYKNDNIHTTLTLPNSLGGYGMGSGFNDSFDTENLITQNFKRQYVNDIIIVQHLKRRSQYYYFEIDPSGFIILNRIFTIFRYSNNYGIEPEIIELNQYLIGKKVSEIDLKEIHSIEKRMQQEIPNNQWRYKIKPDSELIEPLVPETKK